MSLLNSNKKPYDKILYYSIFVIYILSVAVIFSLVFGNNLDYFVLGILISIIVKLKIAKIYSLGIDFCNEL